MFHAERDGKDCDRLLFLPGGAGFFGEQGYVLFFADFVQLFVHTGALLCGLGHSWDFEVAREDNLLVVPRLASSPTSGQV